MSRMGEEQQREFMEEMRREMLEEEYYSSTYEFRMRTDDDFWWEQVDGALKDEPLSEVGAILKHMCDTYDRVYADERDWVAEAYL